MTRDERRLLLYFALFMSAVLVLAGVVLRGWVARTLEGEEKVNLAFLDLSLRDRSRFLGDLLSDQLAEHDRWPESLGDLLTRNHADYNRDIFMQVFALDGSLVAQSANTPGQVPLSAAAVAEQGWRSHDVRSADGRPLRLVVYPVYTGLGTESGIKFHGYAQAGLLMPDAPGALARFTWVMAASLAGFGLLTLIALRVAVLVASQRLRRESESVQASQQRFVADAAHELGTPLAVLRGEIDIALRRERTAEDYRTALTNCREEIERLSRLSENLLSLASADAGQALVEPAACDAAVLAEAVHRRFVRAAGEKGVVFSVEAPDSLTLRADATAVEQVLGNLVANAIRHTPAGESVRLSATAEANAVVFRVTDSGEGIPPVHLPRLFDRFHRVDKARSRPAGGAGLGLAIVKTLVEAHGGTVAVVSTLGKGSEFTCRFPLTDAME
jgi:signal transduction histidine kinase